MSTIIDLRTGSITITCGVPDYERVAVQRCCCAFGTGNEGGDRHVCGCGDSEWLRPLLRVVEDGS